MPTEDFENINYKADPGPLPSREIPPYNGFGSEEDSLATCLSLRPKPTRRDFKKFMEKDRCVLKNLGRTDLQCICTHCCGCTSSDLSAFLHAAFNSFRKRWPKFFYLFSVMINSTSFSTCFCHRKGLESNVLRFVARLDTTRPIDVDRR